MTLPAASDPPPASPFFDPAHPNFAAFTGTPATLTPIATDPVTDTAKQALLAQFAADNSLQYRPLWQARKYPGSIFSEFNTGEVAMMRDQFTTTTGRQVEISNFEPFARLHQDPEGKYSFLPAGAMWGVVALGMDRQLPNMMLVSKQHREGDNVLPALPDPDQVLSLEGDFDDYFTLYCPKEFETDALYVFTPDLMALLIDTAPLFDVEIVDTWMFFYAIRPFDPLDPGVYRRIFQILDTIGTKIVKQTSFYSNASLGPIPDPTPATGWHYVPNPALTTDYVSDGTRLKTKSQLPALYVALGLFGLFALALAVIVTIARLNQ